MCVARVDREMDRHESYHLSIHSFIHSFIQENKFSEIDLMSVLQGYKGEGSEISG